MFPLSDNLSSQRLPFVTLATVCAFIYFFYLSFVAIDPAVYIQAHALVPETVNFQIYETLYQFVISLFYHGGFLHILVNVWFLLVFGRSVEERLGYVLYAVFLVVTGILGNLAIYFYTPSSLDPFYGASGIVAAVIAAHFALFSSAKIKTLIPILNVFTFLEFPRFVMVIYWVILEIIALIGSLPFAIQQQPTIAISWIVGFLGGFLIAKILDRVIG